MTEQPEASERIRSGWWLSLIATVFCVALVVLTLACLATARWGLAAINSVNAFTCFMAASVGNWGRPL